MLSTRNVLSFIVYRYGVAMTSEIILSGFKKSGWSYLEEKVVCSKDLRKSNRDDELVSEDPLNDNI